MKEWLETSAFSSVLGIVIAIVLLILVLKVFQKVTRPLFIIAIVVAGVLIFFNVLDLTLLASTGKKLLQLIWDGIYDAGTNAISNSDLNPANLLKK